jgi:hypothetical protein
MVLSSAGLLTSEPRIIACEDQQQFAREVSDVMTTLRSVLCVSHGHILYLAPGITLHIAEIIGRIS